VVKIPFKNSCLPRDPDQHHVQSYQPLLVTHPAQ